MIFSRRIPFALISSATILLAASWLATGSTAIAGHNHEDIRQLRGAGQILSLETIIANHRHRHPGGQLLEAELEFEQGRYVYALKFLGNDGVVQEFEYDARTGELWHIEKEEESEKQGDSAIHKRSRY